MRAEKDGVSLRVSGPEHDGLTGIWQGASVSCEGVDATQVVVPVAEAK